MINENKNRVIFIVEDNALYSLMLDYKISNDSTAKCICFHSGEECLEAMNMDPMLIVLDYELPGMNGMETLKKIKQLKPNVPVVILTVNKDPKLREALFAEGIYDYLVKEKDAEKNLKEIINVFLKTVSKNEEKSTTRLKAVCYFLFAVALVVVMICLKSAK